MAAGLEARKAGIAGHARRAAHTGMHAAREWARMGRRAGNRVVDRGHGIIALQRDRVGNAPRHAAVKGFGLDVSLEGTVIDAHRGTRRAEGSLGPERERRQLA